MYDASWKRDNISLFECVNFLVLVRKLLALALTLGLIEWLELLLEGCWASRESQSRKTPTYKKTYSFQY
jgi:hypothetical protein